VTSETSEDRREARLRARLGPALRQTMAYPNGRVTSSNAGWTRGGENSHVAVSDGFLTAYLCGLATRPGHLVWPTVDRSNISCGNCRRAVRRMPV
jgi:hypothetical protein